MAILFAANEPESFILQNTSDVEVESSDSSRFDSNFTRGAMQIASASNAMEAQFESQTDVWVAFYLSISDTSIGQDYFEIGDKDTGQSLFKLNNDDTSAPKRWNGSSFTNDSNTFFISDDTLYRFDIHIVINDSTGLITMYVNGSELYSFTGDTNVTDVNNIGYIKFRRTLANVNGIFDTYLSQVLVSTSDTRGQNVMTLYPNGSGASSDWSGSYTDIDDFPSDGSDWVDDTDFVSSTAAAQTHTFALSSATVSDYKIDALVVGARARRGSTGPQNLQIGFRSSTGAEDYSTNVSGFSGVNFRPFQYISTQNPADSADWELSDLGALEIGLKSVA